MLILGLLRCLTLLYEPGTVSTTGRNNDGVLLCDWLLSLKLCGHRDVFVALSAYSLVLLGALPASTCAFRRGEFVSLWCSYFLKILETLIMIFVILGLLGGHVCLHKILITCNSDLALPLITLLILIAASGLESPKWLRDIMDSRG